MADDEVQHKRLDDEPEFASLQPICNAIMLSATSELQSDSVRVQPSQLEGNNQHNVTEKLIELASRVEAMDQNAVQRCAEYILLPILLILPSDFKQRPNYASLPQRRVEATVAAFHVIVIKCGSKFVQSRDDILFPIFERCVHLLRRCGDMVPNCSPVAPEISEESKMSAVNCLKCLFSSNTSKCRFLLNSLNFRGMVGLTVTLLLALVKDEKNRQLRVTSLQALQCILFQVKNRDTISQMLPGISTTLYSTALADYKEGTLLPATAISTLTITILLSLSDAALANDGNVAKVIGASESTSNELKNKLGSMMEQHQARTNSKSTKVKALDNRDPVQSWIVGTWEKLQVLISSIFGSTRAHSAWKVHHELVRLASCCLRHCHKSMMLCNDSESDVFLVQGENSLTGMLLEAVIAGTSHPNKLVANFAQQQFEFIKAKYTASEEWESRVLPWLEKLVLKRLSELPIIANRYNSTMLLEALDRLHALCAVLGKWSVSPEWVFKFKENVVSPLLKVCAIVENTTHVDGTVQIVANTNENKQISVYEYERLLFEYLQDDALVESFGNVVQVLAHGPGIQLCDSLVSSCFELLENNDSTYLKETLYILNQTLRVGQSAKHSVTSEPASTQDDLDPSRLDQWGIPLTLSAHRLEEVVLTSSNEEPHEKPDVARLENALEVYVEVLECKKPEVNTASQVTLALMGIGNVAHHLGSDIKSHLVRILFPILERMGDRNGGTSSSSVRLASASVLRRVAHAEGSNNSAVLLMNNLDYLVDGIIARIPWLHQSPHLPHAIQAIATTVRQGASIDIRNGNNDSSLDCQADCVANGGDSQVTVQDGSIAQPTQSLESAINENSTNKVDSEPTSKATSESTSKVNSESTSKVNSESTSKVNSEPTSKGTSESTSKVNSEPTSKATSEPTSKATSEPTSKATSEPTSKATSESTSKGTSESTSKVNSESTMNSGSTITASIKCDETTSSELRNTLEIDTRKTFQFHRGSLPLWDDLVRAVLQEASVARLEVIPTLMKTLVPIVACLDCMMPGEWVYSGVDSNTNLSRETSPFRSLFNELEALKNAYNSTADTKLEDTIENEESNTEETHEVDKEDLDLQYEDPVGKLLQEILLNCRFFLAHPSIYVRQTTAELVGETASTMLRKSFQDKNTLPTIHKVWPTVVARLEGEENQGIQATLFTVVRTFITHVGDFMKPRFTNDVLPRALSVIRLKSTDPKTVNHSNLPVTGTKGYWDHRSAVLIRSVLQCFASVGSSIGCASYGEHVREVALCTWTFVVQDHDEKARDAALLAWTDIAIQNPESVWPILASIVYSNRKNDESKSKVITTLLHPSHITTSIKLDPVLVTTKHLPNGKCNYERYSEVIESLWKLCQSNGAKFVEQPMK